MDYKDLRVGNIVSLALLDNSIRKEVSINKQQLISILKNELLFEPIPLTEEWLVKFGFEKEVMSYSKNIDIFGGGKRLSFSGDYLYIVDSEKKDTIPTDIITLWNKDVKKQFYVHQLQNLYSALTGEELILK